MAITIPILTDFNGRGIDRGIKQFQQLEGKGAKAGFAIRKAFLPAVAVLAGMAAGAKVAVGSAADMDESLSKTRVLFGAAAKDVEAWSATTAGAFGISRKSALDAAGTFATFGKAAGLTGNDLGKFSKGFTGLAADLASFNNTSPEEAIEAIGSALRGEAEPMRKYGVLLDDASMRQQALSMGIIKTTKDALTPQQKVLAAQALIYKQTGDAQGDFARTSDSLANKQKTLSAQMEDLQASLGQALLPVVSLAASALKGLATWAQKNAKVVKVLIGVFGGLAAAIVAVNAVMKVLGTLSLLTNPIGLVIVGIAALTAGIILLWKRSQAFRRVVETVWKAIKAVVSGVVDYFKGPVVAAWDVIKGAIDAISALIKGDFSDAWDGLKRAAGGVIEWLKTTLLRLPLIIAGLAFEIGAAIVTGIVNGAGNLVSSLWEAIKAMPAALLNLAVGWSEGLGTIGGRIITYIKNSATGLAAAVWNNIKGMATALGNLIVGWKEKLGQLGGNVVGWIRDGITAVWGTITEKAKSAVNVLIGAINKIVDGLNTVSGAINKVWPGPDVPSIPKIPKLAHGGIVTQPTVALIGEAGPEAVIPLNRRGAMGMTINVQAGLVSTPDQVGQQIIEAIQRAQRRSGPAFMPA